MQLLRALSLALALALGAAPAASAATVDATWLGGAGSWDDSANWSGGVVPNQLASPGTSWRVLLGDGSPTLAGAVAVDFLELAGATLNGAGQSLEVLLGLTIAGAAPDTLDNLRLTFTGGSWTQGDLLVSGGSQVISRGTFSLVAANTMTIDGASTWVNEGTLTTTADVLTTINGEFQNAGIILVPQGALRVTGDVVQTDGEIRLDAPAGVAALDTAVGDITTELIIEGGQISGGGLVGKNIRIRNGGLLSPGLGETTYGEVASRGNLTIEPGGRLLLHLGGTGLFDAIRAGGSLNADGLLEVQLTDGYEPAAGDRLLIAASQGNMSVNFANAPVGSRVDTLDGGGSFLLFQDGRNLYLQDFVPIPEPGVGALALAGAAALGAARRRRA